MTQKTAPVSPDDPRVRTATVVSSLPLRDLHEDATGTARTDANSEFSDV